MISEKEVLARFQLLQTKGIGSVSFRHILKIFGSAEKAIEKLPRMSKARTINIPLSENAEKILQDLQKTNQKICFYDSDNYPKNMRALDDLPPVLFYRGNIQLWSQKMIGIVGTRNASLPAIQFTHKIAQALSEKGYGVLSGMALGIDGAAHQGVL
ncbi:MAG: DNA-protecting protein DprA, partial [Alphaproteobacteria bacterium]|nr:DNA-protecting protein DprA [Alphaproteobacteria bacterium]